MFDYAVNKRNNRVESTSRELIASSSTSINQLSQREAAETSSSSDFAVGNRHLLCPSVVAVNKIDGSGHVGYSGETYIGIRSQKHNNSSAFSHHQD